MAGLISIIVPVYNIESKLPRCIDSILKQTNPNFELLLVDDGSSDRTGEICDTYAKNNQRIIALHKKNGGVSSARNVGILHASGDYIVFVDGDDFIAEDYLEKLQLTEEDLTVGSALYTDPDGNVTGVARSEKNLVEQVSVSNMVRWFEHGSLYSVWTSMFRSSIIKEANLEFDEKTTRGEDTIFMFEYVERCKQVRFVENNVYYYVKYGIDGSSSSSLNKKNIKALDYLNRYLEEWFQEHKASSVVFDGYYYWTRNELRLYLLDVIKSRKMGNVEKYDYFKLFFTLHQFEDTDRLFAKSKIALRAALKIKSPGLMTFLSNVYKVFRMENRRGMG